MPALTAVGVMHEGKLLLFVRRHFLRFGPATATALHSSCFIGMQTQMCKSDSVCRSLRLHVPVNHEQDCRATLRVMQAKVTVPKAEQSCEVTDWMILHACCQGTTSNSDSAQEATSTQCHSWGTGRRERQRRAVWSPREPSGNTGLLHVATKCTA